MKRSLHKIASVCMAVVVLLSTMSFTVEKHYCGDSLVDVSILGNLEKCEMNPEKEAVVKSNGCCSDEVVHFEGQDELQKENIQTLTFEQEQFLIACVLSDTCFSLKSSEKLCFRNTLPPDLNQNKNLQVFYQSFLI